MFNYLGGLKDAYLIYHITNDFKYLYDKLKNVKKVIPSAQTIKNSWNKTTKVTVDKWNCSKNWILTNYNYYFNFEKYNQTISKKRTEYITKLINKEIENRIIYQQKRNELRKLLKNIKKTSIKDGTFSKIKKNINYTEKFLDTTILENCHFNDKNKIKINNDNLIKELKNNINNNKKNNDDIWYDALDKFDDNSKSLPSSSSSSNSFTR